jgi:prepilin-type N-terminal cleavage/methylation domain-containing protein
MNTKQTVKGFTIIEVVLVLAIAGLIFLMVFIALPALQSGQRDTQRRSDAARVLSQVNSYQSNTRGTVPNNAATLATFRTNYLVNGGNFNDPQTGSPYTMTYSTTAPTAVGSISFNANRICDTAGTGMTATGANNRNVAIIVKLEGSGGLYCTDNR